MENLDTKTEVKRRVFNSLNLPNFISNYHFDINSNNNNNISNNGNDSIGFDLFKKEMNKVNYLNQTTTNTIRAISHDSIKSLACCLRYNFSNYNGYSISSSSSVNLVKPVALRPKKVSSSSSSSSNDSSILNSQNIPELLPTSMSFSSSIDSSFVLAFNRNSKFVDRRSFSNNEAKLSNSISNQNISTRPHLNLIKMKISNLNETQKLNLFIENNKKDEKNIKIKDDSQTTNTIQRKQQSSLNDDSYISDTSKSSSLTSISNYSRLNSSDVESLDLDQIEKDDLINV